MYAIVRKLNGIAGRNIVQRYKKYFKLRSCQGAPAEKWVYILAEMGVDFWRNEKNA